MKIHSAILDLLNEEEKRKANTCISANIMHVLNWKQTLQALTYMRPGK